jgi:isoleucyl-tRNA synthetase
VYFSVDANTPKKNGGGNTANNNNKKKEKKKESNAYAATVLLPQTTFEMRANSVQKEPLMQKWWLENNVYKHVANRDGIDGKSRIVHVTRRTTVRERRFTHRARVE